jgi:hypothetical protein
MPAIVQRPRCSRLSHVAGVVSLLAVLLLTTLSPRRSGRRPSPSPSPPRRTATAPAPGPSPGTCSLRDAVRFANTHTNATDLTTITLPTSPSLYQLTQSGSAEDLAATGDLDIKANVTINGGGANTTVIDGFKTSADPDRVFQVFSGFTLNLNNVTVQNGKTTNMPPPALVVASGATLTLTNCIVTGNTTTTAGFGSGGGLYNNNASVTLNGTTVSNNDATGSAGGGLYNSGGSATMAVNNSVVSGNHAIFEGGGIFNFGGTLAVTNSQFRTNSVTGTPAGSGGAASGGAIANSSTGRLAVTGSTFTANRATGIPGPPGGGGGNASGGRSRIHPRAPSR